MDVGASRPCRDNLTYFFYRRGWRGVNLEPVPRCTARSRRLAPAT